MSEAIPLLSASCNRPLRELFVGHPEDLRTNKGNVGQLLLRHIGLELDSNLIDFEDGELKTNKASADGTPRETMFITQISRDIDSLVSTPGTAFAESRLYAKIRNLLYLPVVKDAAKVEDWYFTRCIHVQVTPKSRLFAKLQDDYEVIRAGLRGSIETAADGFIHTASGPNYLQIRSKDAKPYNPIFSAKYARNVSNKNHAFYFMKSFMLDALAGALEL